MHFCLTNLGIFWGYFPMNSVQARKRVEGHTPLPHTQISKKEKKRKEKKEKREKRRERKKEGREERMQGKGKEERKEGRKGEKTWLLLLSWEKG